MSKTFSRNFEFFHLKWHNKVTNERIFLHKSTHCQFDNPFDSYDISLLLFIHTMSVFRLTNKLFFSNINIAQNSAILNQNRYLSVSLKHFCAQKSAEDKQAADSSDKDRTKIIPVDISIKYLNSEAYKITYGDKLVWEQYRRNHKGLFPPRKTRKTCIRQGVISTGLYSYCHITRHKNDT